MIIDAHAHVYADPKLRPRPDHTTFMSVADQLAVMDRLGIDKAVILPLTNAEAAAEHQSIGEVLEICRSHPGRFISFCNLDPRWSPLPQGKQADHFEFLLKQCKDLGCKGVGEITARMYFDDPAVWWLFEACERLHLPVTFHTTTPPCPGYGLLDTVNMPRFEKTLQNFPQLNFLGHSLSFWSEISSDVVEDTKNTYPEGPVKAPGALHRLLRDYPNLYGDISAGSGYNALARDPEHAYKFIDEFQDRLVFGLDYCSPKNNHRHLQWLRSALDADNISAQAFDKITWRNVNRILDLQLRP